MKTTAMTFAILFATILSANANPTATHRNAKMHQQQNQFTHTKHHHPNAKNTYPITGSDVMRGRF